MPTNAPDSELPDAANAALHLTDRPAAFFNALLTEQFVLESARGITVSESSSRASIYLTTLSSALVAFGFLARTPFALPFLGTIIPVIVLLGIVTYERLVQTSLEDVAALASIQRIRRFYVTLLPGAAQYFPGLADRRAPNEMLDVGRRRSWRGVFFTLSSAIAVVNSIVVGAGIVILTRNAASGIPVTLGAIAAAASLVLHGSYQEYRYARIARLLNPAVPQTKTSSDSPR